MRVTEPIMLIVRRAVAIAVLATCLTAAMPSWAMAGETAVSVSSSGADLDIVATSGETNNVAVAVDDPAVPTVYLVTDTGAGVNTTSPTCSEPVVGTVSCPVGAINRIDIALSNRNDTAVIAPAVPPTVRSRQNGGSGRDMLSATPAPDELLGGSKHDILFAKEGNDELDGGNGLDSLFGEDGADDLEGDRHNDYLDGGFGGDSMRGGSNTDAVSYVTRTAGVPAQIGATAGNADDANPGAVDSIGADVENLLGGSGNDVLIGDRDGNLLAGGVGDDFLLGLGRGDRLPGGPGNDFISGDFGNDILSGGFGADAMFGGANGDRLRARDRARDISLRCGRGRDRLKRDRVDPRGKSCKQRKRRR